MKKIVLKILSALKLLAYYLFGKISNGLLFTLVGSIGLLVGCIFMFPVVIALGAAIAVSGLVLSFYRENKYIDAIKEVKKLKKEQRNLRTSIGTLNGKIGLLQLDLDEAKEEIKKLRSMKLIEYYDNGDSRYFVVRGKSGPTFSENDKEVG